MKLNAVMCRIKVFIRHILSIRQNNSEKVVPIDTPLAYAEKLIAAGMDTDRASVHAEIWPKLTLYKTAIEFNLSDPVKCTENIINVISIFSKRLLATGEKQEIVELHSETLKDFVICLIITKFSSYSDQRWETLNVKPEEIKHYPLNEFRMLLKGKS